MVSFRQSLTLITILFLFSINATAQTYVSGYVSGAWTPAGSPYIADSTIVIHQDSLLVIQPGVDVRFPGYHDTLKVYGELRAWGTETDSITFYGQDWSGLKFYSTASQNTRMEYCSVVSGYELLDADNIALVFDHCYLHSGRSVRVRYSPLAVLRNCEVYAHFNIQYSTCEARDNLISYLDLLGCSADVRGNKFISGCYIQGSGLFENNIIANAGLEIAYNVRVVNNFIGGGLNLASCSDTIEFNEIRGAIGIHGGGAYIRNNLIISGGTCIDDGPATVVNNTLVCLNESGAGSMIRLDYTCGATIRNNIFYGSGRECVGVYNHGQQYGEISYNTFWNLGTPYIDCSPTVGDTIADPLFVDAEEGDYGLRPDSPCIDSGDPDDPSDPDGSRCDRGWAFFDHRIDHPPVIFSPTFGLAQRGFEFSYTALAVDDGHILNLSFLDLPSWLTMNPPELVYDRLTVSGEVLAGGGDFFFTVVAEDGIAQSDTERVEVEATDYTVLTGNITVSCRSGVRPI